MLEIWIKLFIKLFKIEFIIHSEIMNIISAINSDNICQGVL